MLAIYWLINFVKQLCFLLQLLGLYAYCNKKNKKKMGVKQNK